MKIGVDARNLLYPNNGIGRYVAEACKAFRRCGHELYFYLPAPISEHSRIPDAIYRQGEFTSAFGRIWWGEFQLGRLAADDPLDMFWGPAHRLPKGLDPNIPSVVTIHDLVWLHYPHTMKLQPRTAERLLMPRALKRASLIATVSVSTEQAVKKAFPQYRDKVRTFYPGLTSLALPEPLTLPLAARLVRPYALFVGTLEPRKNLKALLTAYAQLPPAVRRGTMLVIAGGTGWRMGKLENLVSELGVSEDVLLTGFVSEGILSELYRGARFLAFPSLYEGFGFPIIEANSFGIPVLTSNVSSMPEIGGSSALYVNPNDVDEISSGFMRLATDQQLYTSLANHARANAARFNWDGFAQQLTSSLAPLIID